MARITVEDCLNQVDNRFKLIHMAAKRVRMFRKGEKPLVDSKNTDVVVALREIAAGKVFETEHDEEQVHAMPTLEDFESKIIPEQASGDSLGNEDPGEENASIEQ
jgi:DNA-directed RNA polymerase subunit omega